MVQQINNWLAQFGLSLPVQFDVSTAAIAAILAIGLWAAGWFLASLVAPRINAYIDNRTGGESDDTERRVTAISRFGLIALFETILFNAWGWDRLSIVIVGIALAIAATLFINKMARILRLPRWAAVLLAAAVFVLIISRLLGGVQPVFDAFDMIGFDVGSTRISILTVLTFVITALLLFIVVRLASRVTNHAIQSSRGFDAAQKLLAMKLASIAIAAVAFFVGIDLLGIDLTALAVFSGAFGLAVGFGFQKTFGNLISGILLLMDRSIKPGDVIAVGDSFGWVNKIGIRSVSIITRDGKEHLIPNENLMTNEVENWSYSSKNVRVRIPVGVSYKADMKLCEELMMKAAAESPRVLKTPSPNVWMTEYGDSSVNFEILAWIRDPEEGVGNVRSDVLKRLWWLFKENDVEIPFPQRDVHLRDLPPELLHALSRQASDAQ